MIWVTVAEETEIARYEDAMNIWGASRRNPTRRQVILDVEGWEVSCVTVLLDPN